MANTYEQKSTFKPNTKPPPTDDPVASAKPEAKAQDEAKAKGVTSITGKALEGDALSKFKGLWDKSALIRASYNPDGSLKADVEKITE